MKAKQVHRVSGQFDDDDLFDVDNEREAGAVEVRQFEHDDDLFDVDNERSGYDGRVVCSIRKYFDEEVLADEDEDDYDDEDDDYEEGTTTKTTSRGQNCIIVMIV